MKILYKFATRSRPEKAAAVIQNILMNAEHAEFSVLMAIDSDDSTMADFVLQNGVEAAYGTSKSKIEAINRDIPADGWDILINVSDDQLFTVKGFDLDILIAMGNNTDQFLHFPDGFVNERLCTMTIIGKKYYDRFGYVYHSDYASLWCDNEAQEEAIRLGCYKYVDKHIFIHNHPAWIGGKVDAQLEHTQKFYRQDERTYRKRRLLNFPIKSIYS